MIITVRPHVTVNAAGLDSAQRVMSEALRRALNNLGVHLQKALRGRIKKSSGEEQRNIKSEVTGKGLNLFLYVFGDTVQLHVDEEGLPPGTFPPWDAGTRMYRYAQRRIRRAKAEKGKAPARRRNSGGRDLERKASHVSTRRPGPRAQRIKVRGKARKGRRKVAKVAASRPERTVARNGATRRLAFLIARAVYEHGIRARHPIAKTFEANKGKIVTDIRNAFLRAINQINRGA